jgi:hypothetical protein
MAEFELTKGNVQTALESMDEFEAEIMRLGLKIPAAHPLSAGFTALLETLRTQQRILEVMKEHAL